MIFTSTLLSHKPKNLGFISFFELTLIVMRIRAYEEGGNGPDRPFVDTEVTIVIEVISTSSWFPLFT